MKDVNSDTRALIEQIRKEVQLRKGKASQKTLSKGESAELRSAAGALERVQTRNEQIRKWPRLLRPIRNNQHAINESLSKALEHLIKENQRLRDSITALNAKTKRHHEMLATRINEATNEMALGSAGLNVLSNKVDALENAMQLLESQVSQAPGWPHAKERSFADSLMDKQLDAFYLEFENQFRGSRDLIRSRLLHYVPLLTALKERFAGLSSFPAVDIGCGRGEWLELLKENGFAVRGADINARMAEYCRSLGFETECGDGIAWLRNLPAESLSLVSGFHIVEHMPLSQLLELFKQSLRVLRPGGIAIFETPNPDCLKVSTYTFFFDPTHRNPIPKELLSFIGTHAGFTDAKIELLSPQHEGEVFVGHFDYVGVFTK